jgi:hypothetical protein
MKNEKTIKSTCSTFSSNDQVIFVNIVYVLFLNSPTYIFFIYDFEAESSVTI